MHLINKKNNTTVIAASVATLFTFAIMATAVSNMATTTPATATATAAATPNNTTATSSSGIELSPEPVFQGRQITVSGTPINQTHFQLTTSGNGVLTLPNGTETINTTSTGSVIVSMDGTAAGKEVIRTEDGSESATATYYGIGRFNMEAGGTGKSIIIELADTNSTGRLAPLNSMILAGQIEFPPDETHSLVTLWEWQSGIPLPTSTTESMEEPPIMNTTTMITTNATTTADDDINATGAVPEEEIVEEQQQQATPTAPSPLFE
jgi:hypothetical protein